MESVYVRVLTLLLAVCSLSSVRGQPTCMPKKDNPCVCVGSNFTLNLGAAFQAKTSQNISDADDPDGPTSFVISPCVDIDCGEKKARACQYDVKNDAFVVLCTASSIAWTVTDENNYVVTFEGGDPTYDGKKARQAVFTGVVKDIKEPTFTYDGEDQNQEEILPYKFTVTYKNAAPLPGGGDSVVGIAGIVIIILLIAAVAAYFIIGAIVMYTVKGARGVEVVPNFTFWKALPLLIKDGFMFTISPCTTRCGKQGGYSSL